MLGFPILHLEGMGYKSLMFEVSGFYFMSSFRECTSSPRCQTGPASPRVAVARSQKKLLRIWCRTCIGAPHTLCSRNAIASGRDMAIGWLIKPQLRA